MPPQGDPDGALSAYARAVTRRDLVVDAVLAAVVFAVSVGVLAAHGLGMPDPTNRDLNAVGVLLAAGAALPLVARRVAPLPVYAFVSVAALSMLVLDYALDVPFGPMVALYAVAESYGGDQSSAEDRPSGADRSSRGDRSSNGVRSSSAAGGRVRRWSALAAGAAFVPATAAAYALSGERVRPVPELLVIALMMAGVWVAGDRSRLRRERVAELEERAVRAEREAERERRLAAAEERTRIARELHDSAGHAINVILVQAGAARLLHDRDPAASRASITAIEDVARATIGDIDRLVWALRKEEGDEAVVPADPAAFEELLEQHRNGGLQLRTDLRGERRQLPQGVAWAAYRILQEALTNAARHGPGTAEVTVGFEPDALAITVMNPTRPTPVGNPRGTEDGSVARTGGGHGIVGMRERASLLGGTLEAAAAPGSFRLYAWLPYVRTAT